MKRKNKDALNKEFFHVFNMCKKNSKYKALIFVSTVDDMKTLYEEVIRCFVDIHSDDVRVLASKNSIEIKMNNGSIFTIAVAAIGYQMRANDIFVQDTIQISFIESVIEPMQCAYISENNTVKNPVISYFSME